MLSFLSKGNSQQQRIKTISGVTIVYRLVHFTRITNNSNINRTLSVKIVGFV